VQGDPDYLEHAMTNLIDNAIKYSCDDKRVWIGVARDSRYGIFRIRDAGRGISPQALAHLGERFYRDPAYGDRVQGAGVGLYLVKHIMEAHGGRIEVHSVPGAGSTFSLAVPLAQEQG
jgi:signal transduction histidine kinase